MITSIDFGCHSIRSARRSQTVKGQINLVDQRAEYVVLPSDEDCRQLLSQREIGFADCEDSIVVFGNKAADARWLSRKPCASLFHEGQVPKDDPPARQILNLLTKALLIPVTDQPAICCFTVPGGRSATDNLDFLSRLIRMNGYAPLHCAAATATMLAAGNETNFNGIAIVMGSESTEIAICRYGIEIATETVSVGSNWIDMELARQFKMQTWDEQGDCYLNLEGVRRWKHGPNIHLRNTVSEREKTLSRLYGVVLTRVAGSVRRLLLQPQVQAKLGHERLTIFCSGGPTLIHGFSGALTERLVEHDIASRLTSVRVVDDAHTAVVRGLLIQAELEVRRSVTRESAA